MGLLIRNNSNGFESAVTGRYAVKNTKNSEGKEINREPVIPEGYTLITEMADEQLTNYFNEKVRTAMDLERQQ